MARIVSIFGDSPLTRLNNVSIMLMVSFSIGNLTLIVLMSFYISAVDRSFRHHEIKHWPLFGLPILLMIASIFAFLLWKIANCFLQLPSGYGWFSVFVTSACLFVAAPALAYGFFFRLNAKRHGNWNGEYVRADPHKNEADPHKRLLDTAQLEFEALLLRTILAAAKQMRAEKDL